jgi:hypothetical protein
MAFGVVAGRAKTDEKNKPPPVTRAVVFVGETKRWSAAGKEAMHRCTFFDL